MSNTIKILSIYSHVKWLIITLNRRLKEQLIETWSKDRKCSSRGHAYKIILKHNIGFEKYPDILTSKTMKNHHKISYIKPSSPFKAMQADGIVHLKMRDYVYCVAMTQRRWDSLVFFKTFSLRRNERKKSLDIS